jgi:lysophospholipase L1-like esterase
MDLYYGSGPLDAWLGDEDQGQMGAWFVMSAMGLFEMDGGASLKPVYEIGSPIFEKITISLDTAYYPGMEFVIEAKNTSSENPYIQSAKLNGNRLEKPWFYHKDLVKGGRLELVMGPRPNMKWGSRPEDAPPSLSSLLSPEELEKIMNYEPGPPGDDFWALAMKQHFNQRTSLFRMLPNTENEIVMLGNSITAGGEWKELFPGVNIINRGIGGDVTDGVLERLDEVTESLPAKIFILIGTNDLAALKTPEYIIDNYGKILDRIRNASPATEIYIQSILPTDDSYHTTRKNSDIRLINMNLERMARESGLVYIDLYSHFVTPDSKMNPAYSNDGLHLTGEGFRLWKSLISKYIYE